MAARFHRGMGRVRSHLKDGRWRQDKTGFRTGERRGLSSTLRKLREPSDTAYTNANFILQQTKTVETTLEALSEDNNSNLPPLMNPTMLEASDDLTNLSHLNEPAGMTFEYTYHIYFILMDIFSPPSHSVTIFAKRNIHLLWYRPNSHEPLRSGRFSICPWHGPSIRGETAGNAGAASFCHC